MKFWKKLKSEYEMFIKRPPGQRFIEHYEWSKVDKKPWASPIEIFLAIFFIAISILFGLTPILPGFVFFLVALLLIAKNSRTTALLLDKLEMWLRKKILKRKKNQA